MKNHEISNQTQMLLDRAFMTHPAKQDQHDRIELLRTRTEGMALQFCKITPDSMEQREMVRCLREAHFWALEAISKNEIGTR